MFLIQIVASVISHCEFFCRRILFVVVTFLRWLNWKFRLTGAKENIGMSDYSYKVVLVCRLLYCCLFDYSLLDEHHLVLLYLFWSTGLLTDSSNMHVFLNCWIFLYKVFIYILVFLFQLQRNILASNPRVTRFHINWEGCAERMEDSENVDPTSNSMLPPSCLPGKAPPLGLLPDNSMDCL